MKFLLILIIFIISASGVNLDAGELGITGGYPYLGLKYNFSDAISGEARYATGSGVKVYAGRFYWNFSRYDKLSLFTGPEFGYVNFNTYDMKGSGYETGVMLGMEYFITPGFSFMMDFTPVVIGLKSDNYKVSGVEFVLNLGLNFYFGNAGSSSGLKESAKVEYQSTSITSTPIMKEKTTLTSANNVNVEVISDTVTVEQEGYEDYIKKADEYLSLDDLDNAFNEYGKALKSISVDDERQIYILERQGYILDKQNNCTRAKKFYASAINLSKKLNVKNKDVVNAYLGLAYCQKEEGNSEMALKNYKAALKITDNPSTKKKIEKKIKEIEGGSN
jgi:predicted negative regulator of RcsB-dependent stress response